MIRNQAGQSIGAQMISATTGAAYVGTVTVYITIDAGTQAIGSVGSGLCTAEGNGYFTYRPTADETAGDLVAFTFIGSGAIPQTIQVSTVTEAVTSAIGASGSTGSSISFTAENLIYRALRLLGILAEGETPTAEQSADAFGALNWLVDAWGTQRLTMYTMARGAYTWPAAASSKTIGPTGGDFTAARPQAIEAARFIPTGLTVELYLGVWGEREYADVVDKTITSSIPCDLYVENTDPLMILRPYPIPSAAGTLVLYVNTALTQFANLTTTYTLPPGYYRALLYNLALEISPFFDVTSERLGMVGPIALSSLADIKRVNVNPPILTVPWGPYNIYTDQQVPR